MEPIWIMSGSNNNAEELPTANDYFKKFRSDMSPEAIHFLETHWNDTHELYYFGLAQWQSNASGIQIEKIQSFFLF